MKKSYMPHFILSARHHQYYNVADEKNLKVMVKTQIYKKISNAL